MQKNIELKQRTKQKVVFKNPFPQKEIRELKSSCGCSKPKTKGDEIIVMFKAKSIPAHLIYKGYFTSTSYITITYTDGTRKLLYITAKVIK